MWSLLPWGVHGQGWAAVCRSWGAAPRPQPPSRQGTGLLTWPLFGSRLDPVPLSPRSPVAGVSRVPTLLAHPPPIFEPDSESLYCDMRPSIPFVKAGESLSWRDQGTQTDCTYETKGELGALAVGGGGHSMFVKYQGPSISSRANDISCATGSSVLGKKSNSSTCPAAALLHPRPPSEKEHQQSTETIPFFSLSCLLISLPVLVPREHRP